MRRNFTLEYWLESDWHVGRLKEVLGVFSQGKSLDELEENIRDAYNTSTRIERHLALLCFEGANVSRYVCHA